MPIAINAVPNDLNNQYASIQVQDATRVFPKGEDDPSLQKVKKVEQDQSGIGKDHLTEEELKKVEELKRRDAEVRAHEQAHKSAAGSLSSGSISFDYETGPDGNRYAVGGEVSIDTSKIDGNPQATIAKAQQIQKAALAPADPSGQDRQVAAQAIQLEIEANKELSSSKKEQGEEGSFSSKNASSNENVDFYKNIQRASSSNDSLSFLDYYV